MHLKKILSVALSALVMVPTIASLAAEDPHGLKAEYYLVANTSSYDYTDLKQTTIINNTLDFSDLTADLQSQTGAKEFAGIRWSGQVQAPVTGTYTFYIKGDNGFKLWVNDQLLINHWVNDWDVEQTSSTISLTAGQKYSFKLEYFQATGGANIHVSWSATGTSALTKEIIPADSFFLDSAYTGTTVSSVDLSKATLVSNNPSGTITFNGNNLQGATVEILDVSGKSYNPKVFCDVASSTNTKIVANVPDNLPVGKLVFAVSNNGSTYKTAASLSTYDYGDSQPRPETPRPDWNRDKWMNLNGQWRFDFDGNSTGESNAWYSSHTYSQNIIVPYPWESPLSQINNPDYEGTAWYERDLTLDSSWAGKKIVLNFGAVDWKCSLWVNGQKVGDHVGGYSQFSFDISSFVQVGSDKTNKITLMVYDNKHADNTQLVGKQDYDAPCGYTSSSGIWQTVYLEGLDSSTYLESVHATPDIDTGKVTFDVKAFNSNSSDANVTVDYNFIASKYNASTDQDDTYSDSTIAGTQSLTLQPGEHDYTFTVAVPNQKLWDNDNPYLYKGSFTLKQGAAQLDKVNTYFGQKKISEQNYSDRSYQYINLNNKPVFLSGLLNQGFWRDGVYTAPTDASYKYDLQTMKNDGFNLLRNHIKIEDPRELYWADQLGMCIWEDMPQNYAMNVQAGRDTYEFALDNMLQRDYNHPSVIAIILFNETWGVYKDQSFHDWQTSLYNKVKTANPQLLVEDMSPCNLDHVQPTDMDSFHMYPGTFTSAKDTINDFDSKTTVGSNYNFQSGYTYQGEPWLNSEYGGVAAYSGDMDVSWCFKYQTTLLRLHEKLNGFIYTEPYDVEYESNGILNYNRTPKTFGYDEIAYGGDMSIKYLTQPNFIGFYNDPIQTLAPGSTFTGQIGAQNWSGNTYSGLKLKYRLDGTDAYGNSISTGIEGSQAVTFAPYTQENKQFTFTIPNQAIYNKFVGTVTAWIEDADGNVIAKNFTNIKVTDSSAMQAATKLTDNSFALRDAAASPDASKVQYTYTVPDDMDVSSLSQLKVIAELSSNKNTIAQTSASEAAPSDVTVSINGHEITTVTLPDGPVDMRGTLSLNSGSSAGQFGYLTDLTVPAGIISQLKTELVSSKTITVTYQIKDNAANKNGIRFYDENSGRYAVSPMIILNPNQTAEDTMTGNGSAQAIGNTDYFANGSVEATVTPAGDNQDTAGLTARVSGDNGYYASVSKDGTVASIQKLDGTVVKSVTGLSLTGSSHKLKFELADAHLKLFVDDAVVPVVDAYDYSFSKGSVGVNNTNGAASFADILIGNETYGLANDDATAVNYDADQINVSSVVTGNIALPSIGNNGSTITWASSNGMVISTDGVVNRQPTDFKVTLTATVKKGSQTKTRAVVVTVKGCSSAAIRLNMDSAANGTLTDEIGGSNATIVGSSGKVVNDSTRGNVLSIDSSSYAKLPSGIMKDYSEMTVSAWFKPGSAMNSSDWMRLFDFGSDTNHYIMFTIKNSGGKGCQISFKNGDGTEIAVVGPVIQPNVWTHMAMTYQNHTAILYINGVEVVRLNNAFDPSVLGNTTNNYIGKSQWPDANYVGLIDDFRVYPSALTANNVAAMYASKPVTTISFQDSSLTMYNGDTAANPAAFDVSDFTGKTVTWTSSNTNVATVDAAGNVTAKAAGTANITVTVDSVSKSYTVTVNGETNPTNPTDSTNPTESTGTTTSATSATSTASTASTAATNPTDSNSTSTTAANNTTKTTAKTTSSSGTTAPNTGNPLPYSALLLAAASLPVAVFVKGKKSTSRR